MSSFLDKIERLNQKIKELNIPFYHCDYIDIKGNEVAIEDKNDFLNIIRNNIPNTIFYHLPEISEHSENSILDETSNNIDKIKNECIDVLNSKKRNLQNEFEVVFVDSPELEEKLNDFDKQFDVIWDKYNPNNNQNDNYDSEDDEPKYSDYYAIYSDYTICFSYWNPNYDFENHPSYNPSNIVNIITNELISCCGKYYQELLQLAKERKTQQLEKMKELVDEMNWEDCSKAKKNEQIKRILFEVGGSRNKLTVQKDDVLRYLYSLGIYGV